MQTEEIPAEVLATIPTHTASGRPYPDAVRLRLLHEIHPEYAPNRGIPLKKKLRIKHLYVTEGHEITAIADDVGLAPEKVRSLIKRTPGWTIQREEIERHLLAADLTKEEELKAQTQEIVDEIGSKSAELVLGTLDMAKDKLEASDAQGLNYAASAAKSFEGMFRKARGLDDGPALGKAGSAVNLFFLASPTREEPKPVEPTEPEPIAVPAEDPDGF